MNATAITAPIAAKIANVTANINQTAAEPVLGNLSWKGFILMMALIIVAGIITFLAMWSETSRKMNHPLYKAFALTVLFSIFALLVEGVFYPDNGAPGWLKTCLIIGYFLGLLIIFTTYKSTLDKKIESFRQRIPNILHELYAAKLNAGDIATPAISDCVVKPADGQYGSKDTDVAHFLATTDQNVPVYMVFGLDSEALLKHEYNPDEMTIKTIFHKVPKKPPMLFPTKMPSMPMMQPHPQQQNAPTA